MKKSKHISQILKIAKVNIRHNFLKLLFISLIIIFLTPILFGTANLDATAVSVPLEMLVSVIGIVFFVPIFQPEHDSGISETVSAKYTDATCVYLIRLLYSIVATVILISLFCLFLFFRGCEITFHVIFGTVADALILGATGLFAASLTDNLPVSIMMSILYYIMSISLKQKLKIFNLFSMMYGDYEPNIYLFSVAIILFALSVIIKNLKSKKQ